MASHYIMISIPSGEHEKSLVNKNKTVSKEKKTTINTIRPNKSTGEMCREKSSSNNFTRPRSMSQDSLTLPRVASTSGSKERIQAAIYRIKNKKKPTMEQTLEKCLEELKISNAVWVLGRANKFYQVSFCTPAGEHCERIVHLLNDNKIGVELNSTVSILPCSLYYEGKEHSLTPNKASSNIPCSSQTYFQGVKELTAWQQFVSSVRARLMVAQVVASVKSNAVFTFDFLILLIIASVTAAVGLVENSVVVLVASMLISPLMGPVMASTFGFATRDWKLHNIGVLSELLGLLLCVLIGFLYGLSVGYLCWESPAIKWPTPEMVTRGDLRSLWVGALIALLSGAAVAIAVLGNYSSSLTGVAISASLMPPAVNAGLLWALAAVPVLFGETSLQDLTSLTSNNPVRELIVLGALSLALTFINIICIFLTGILVLKVKEVTPQGTNLLWKDFENDFRSNLHQADRNEQGATATVGHLPDFFNQHTYRMDLNQCTWSAFGAMQDFNRPTVHDLSSAWQHFNIHTSSMGDNLTYQARPRGSPTPHPTLVQPWSVLSSPATNYSSLTYNSPPPTINSPAPRFTVTPTDVSNIFTI